MSYSYHPIRNDEFRLLEILPSIQDQELRGNLHTVVPGSAGAYGALSYCWGDASRTQSIWIGNEKLRITTSVFSAIQALRQQDQSRFVWIDQVSINQDDIPEKNNQVLNRMGHIYAEATELLIWLGDGDATSELALDTIEWACDEISLRGTCTFYKADLSLLSMRNADGDLDLKPWIAVQKLLIRPWFSRAWIIQEVCLPDTDTISVLCGDKMIPWWKLACIQNAMGQYKWHAHIHEAAPQVRELVALQKPTMSPEQYRDSFKYKDSSRRIINLLSNLWMFRDRVCGDGRDKIYSIKHISNDQAAADLRVDYAADIVDLFTDTARSIIQSTRKLRILGACQMTKNHQGLPSWVPDWTIGSEYRPAVQMTTMLVWEETSGNHIIPKLPARIRPSPHPNALLLQGYHLETIDVVSADRPDRWKPLLYADTLELIDFLAEAATFVMTDPQSNGKRSFKLSKDQRALCDTIFTEGGLLWAQELAQDQTSVSRGAQHNTVSPAFEPERHHRLNGLINQAWLEIGRERTDTIVNSNTLGLAVLNALQLETERELPALWTTLIVGRDVMGEPTTIQNPRGDVFHYLSRILPTLFGRKLFKTQAGDLGMGPYEICQGDCVCMFPGVTTPFILRKDLATGHWSLIGECYCYSYMDGVLGKAILDDASRLEEFCIV